LYFVVEKFKIFQQFVQFKIIDVIIQIRRPSLKYNKILPLFPLFLS